MNKRILIAGALSLAVVLSAAVAAMAQPSPPPIGTEILSSRAQFTDDVNLTLRVDLEDKAAESRPAKPFKIDVTEPSRTVVVRITVQPGAQFPWHTHPGPVIANVTEGELVYVNANDCVHRPYAAGTVFIDPGRRNVHTAFNPTDEPTVVLATFFEAPAEGPLTIPQTVEPGKCGMDSVAHNH